MSEALKLLIEKYAYLHGELTQDEIAGITYGYLNGLRDGAKHECK